MFTSGETSQQPAAEGSETSPPQQTSSEGDGAGAPADQPDTVSSDPEAAAADSEPVDITNQQKEEETIPATGESEPAAASKLCVSVL